MNKITIQDIIDNSKKHYNGRRTVLTGKGIQVSIVGGGPGLYGDFVEDFELAIIDTDSGFFVTKFFFPNSNDDVIPHMKAEDLIYFLNGLFSNGFQVQ